MTYRIICIYLCLLSIGGRLSSQNQKIAEVDSVIMAYYQNCLSNLQDPIVLSMADTLFAMATQDGDQRMQAVALCTNLDYYYYSQHEHKTDSIIEWTERVKRFARKTNQPKYYYFVWTNRLITYYLKQGELNMALIESEKVMREAKSEDYKEGIADCYLCLSNIYAAKQMAHKRLEFAIKEIELFEKYDLERYNISIRYSTAAETLIDFGNIEEAEKYLGEGCKHTNTLYQEVNIKLTYARLYLKKEEFNKAFTLLEECRQLFAANPKLKPYISALYVAWVNYYTATEEYEKALEMADLYEESLIEKGEHVSIAQLNKRKGNIYWHINNKEKAAEFYRLSLEELEKEKGLNEEKTTAEFATLLNMQNLTYEKQELERLAKKKQLHHMQVIITLLAALLFFVGFFLYRQRKSNRELRESRDELDQKNQALLRAEKELKQAKELAEESSRLKTVFIQNMSHEIRTPLNSIVGFSAVLAEVFSDGNPEVKKFTELIGQNSHMLLKMINEILCISDLDKENQEISYGKVDINDCCLRAIEEISPFINQGVKLLFTPSTENLIIESNEELLMHILRNLLDNAAKFTSSGEIILDLQIEPNKEMRLSVTDTGMGIPADKHEAVFERFFKLDDFKQGTGLGLSISRLAVERLGGKLTIDKNYTQGTRFVFNIPLHSSL